MFRERLFKRILPVLVGVSLGMLKSVRTDGAVTMWDKARPRPNMISLVNQG